jgi:hypothetical protein
MTEDSDAKGSMFDLAELRKLGGFKAGDLLAVDPKLYGKFMVDLGKTIKRDETTKNLGFLAGCSAYTSDPINLYLSGETSIGKTYNAVETTKHFPKEDVWLLGGLSPTALIHQYGILVDKNGEEIAPDEKPGNNASAAEKDAWRKRLKDSYYFVDLKEKILIFLEAPSFETLNMLRPILSHDAKEISYRFTDKSGQGQLQTKHVVIRNWPATIFCSTREKYVRDLATRGFSHTPETTECKYQDANVLTGSKAAFPWKFGSDFDFMLLQAYIRFLKNNSGKVKVIVPYAEDFAQKFPAKFSRSMRDFKRLLSLISVFAQFHFAQRPALIREVKLEIHGKDPDVPEYREVQETYILATRFDFDSAMQLWNEIQETTETSAPGHIVKFYHQVVEQLATKKLKELQNADSKTKLQISDVEFSVEDLTDFWNASFDDKKSSDSIRRWANFLCDIGYLTEKTDPQNKKRNLYEVIHENEKFRKYTHFSFASIFTLDSLKAWLNKANSITANNQISLKESIVNERDITIEELFNKHFLSETPSDAVIDSSDSKASPDESGKNITANQKTPYLRNFQQANGEAEKAHGQVTLDDVKCIHWDPKQEVLSEHECSICGYKKLTSWQAETFKQQQLWICEECKVEWEQKRDVT